MSVLAILGYIRGGCNEVRSDRHTGSYLDTAEEGGTVVRYLQAVLRKLIGKIVVFARGCPGFLETQ